MKTLFSSINIFVLIFTFIFAPIPSINFNVYAQESIATGGCQPTDSAQGENQTFTVGCDTQAAVAATTLSDNTGDQGKIIGIIQQAVTSMMAVVLIKSLFYRYNRVYAQNCPTDKTARITMLMAQLSSLSYLVGDLISNIQFKKLAEEATEKAFLVTNKADDKGSTGDAKIAATMHNDEQIRSFDTLIKVLDGQRKAMSTKLALSAAATTGYLAAEVVELTGMLGSSITASANMAAYCSARAAALVAIQSSAAPLAATICAPTAAAVAQAKVLRENSMTVQKSASESVKIVKDKGWIARQLATIQKKFTDFISLVKSSFEEVTQFLNLIPAERLAEKAKEKAEEATEIAKAGVEKATDTAEVASMAASGAACISTATAAVATAAAASAASAGAASPALVKAQADLAAATIAVPALNAAFVAEQGADLMPLTCNGHMGDLGAGSSGVNLSCPLFDPTQNFIQRDFIKTNPNEAVVDNQINQFNAKDVFLNVLENNLYAHSYSLINRSNNSEENLKKVLSYFKTIDQKMKALRYQLKNIDIDKTFIESRTSMTSLISLASVLFNNLSPVSNAKANIITSTISSMVMKKIGHKLGGPWEEILKLGSKYQMLSGILDMLGQNYLFVKKKNRSITWGLMTVASGAVTVFDINTLKKIKEHKEVIEKEKRKFLESSGSFSAITQGAVGDYDSTDDSYELFDYGNQPLFNNGGQALIACASPVAGGFIPDTCRNRKKSKAYSIPKLSYRNVPGVDYNGLGEALNFVSNSSYNAGSGQYIKNPSLLSSTLSSANGHNNALKNVRNKLRARVDKLEKKYNKKNKVSSKLETPLQKIAKEFESQFAKPIAIDPSVSKGLYQDIEKKKPSLVASNKPVKVSIPSVSSRKLGDDFSMDFGDEDELEDESVNTLSEVKAGEIIIEHQDIVKKPEVSIFKVLSNRYLINYPNLLEERKK